MDIIYNLKKVTLYGKINIKNLGNINALFFLLYLFF